MTEKQGERSRAKSLLVEWWTTDMDKTEFFNKMATELGLDTSDLRYWQYDRRNKPEDILTMAQEVEARMIQGAEVTKVWLSTELGEADCCVLNIAPIRTKITNLAKELGIPYIQLCRKLAWLHNSRKPRLPLSPPETPQVSNTK